MRPNTVLDILCVLCLIISYNYEVWYLFTIAVVGFMAQERGAWIRHKWSWEDED